jgi:hypothetical protein
MDMGTLTKMGFGGPDFPFCASIRRPLVRSLAVKLEVCLWRFFHLIIVFGGGGGLFFREGSKG